MNLLLLRRRRNRFFQFLTTTLAATTKTSVNRNLEFCFLHTRTTTAGAAAAFNNVFPSSSYYVFFFLPWQRKQREFRGLLILLLKRHARCPSQVSSYPLFVHERRIKKAAKYVRNAPNPDVLKSTSQKGGRDISCPAKPQNAFNARRATPLMKRVVTFDVHSLDANSHRVSKRRVRINLFIPRRHTVMQLVKCRPEKRDSGVNNEVDRVTSLYRAIGRQFVGP